MTNLLSPQEAAARLGICTRTLRKHVTAGELDYIPTGRGSTRQHRMFHPADLDSFIEARRKRECPPIDHPAESSSSTISNFKVIDFTAPRSAPTSATRTPTKKPGAKKPLSNLRKLRV